MDFTKALNARFGKCREANETAKFILRFLGSRGNALVLMRFANR